VVVIGNKGGKVGVGVAKAKEVIIAVQKAVTDAKKNLAIVPMTAVSSVPHKLTVLGCGSSKVMIRPALEGSGITAGGSVRAVLELAGYKNVNAKMLAGTNPLNNGRAALAALKMMRTPEQVAASRSLTTEEVRARARARWRRTRVARRVCTPHGATLRRCVLRCGRCSPPGGLKSARMRAFRALNPIPTFSRAKAPAWHAARADACARCLSAAQITARMAAARMAPSGL
jgi:small subunit ribosomal protein S5